MGWGVLVNFIRQPMLKLPTTWRPSFALKTNERFIDGEMYSIQHYMIKFVSDVRENDGFLQVVLKFCLWQIDSYKCAFWCKCTRSLCLFRTSQPDTTLDVYNVTCYTTMDYGVCQHVSNIPSFFLTSICPNMFLFDCCFMRGAKKYTFVN
jgi:hypothetical protein